MLLRGKTALITGCLRGIGNSAMQLFARNGANIWACCQYEDASFETSIGRLAAEMDVKIRPLYFDLANSDQIKDAMRLIARDKEPIDILVNNAGMTEDSLFPMTTLDSMRRVFEVNFFSHMLITQYVSKIMMRQKSGSIISVSSIMAQDGNPGQSSYCASKAALIGATKSLALELAEYNIRVNAIAPGVIRTNMTANVPPVIFQKIFSGIPMARLGEADEVASTMLFLASDMASYITGQVIRIDGGIG